MKSYKVKGLLVRISVIIFVMCNFVVAQQPTNDRCQSAMHIGNVVDLPFNTSNATFDGPGNCMLSPNIWYRYIATSTSNLTVSLCGSNFDTVLAVYRGSECYPQQNNLIGCNDDSCGRQSEITFPATAGQEYLIEVGGFGVNKGSGVISIIRDSGQPGTPDCAAGGCT